MRKELFLFTPLLLLLLITSETARAQKFGYVNTKYILKQMPEYKEAKNRIDELSKKWQSKLDKMRDELQELREEYQSEKVLMTEEMKQKKRNEIKEKEEEVKNYQKKVFGPEGMLFLKRKELIQPIQEKVFNAVETVAKKNGLQVVFDKSGELVMVYTNPVHDYTEYVLEELDMKREEKDNKTKQKSKF